MVTTRQPIGADFELPVTAMANGSGVATGTVQAPNVGPLGFEVVSIALTVSPSPPIPVAVVYRNLVAPSNVMAKRTAGDRGTFRGDRDILYMGQQLVIVWTGCSAGATCTAIVRGRAVTS